MNFSLRNQIFVTLSKMSAVYCCDPFKRHAKKQTKQLVAVSKTMIQQAKMLKMDLAGKICAHCKLKLKLDSDEAKARMVGRQPEQRTSKAAARIDIETPGPSSSRYELRQTPTKAFPQATERKLDTLIGGRSPSPPEKMEEGDFAYDVEKVKEHLNELLLALGHEKLDENPDSFRSRRYFEIVVENIKKGLSNSVFGSVPVEKECPDCAEMISQLKDKYHNSADRVKKYQILSVVPKSWNANRTATTFDTTWHMANNAQKMVQQHGILFSVAKKIGSNTIPAEVVNLVKEFYRSDEVSSDRPAINDKISVRGENGEKEDKQIKLILMNLKEAFIKFKEKHENVKIGFSKFASVRPKECLLALDKRGMHAVCVCIYHQNVKLASDSLVRNMRLPPDVKDYKGFCAKLLCATPTVDCHMRTCEACKSDANLRKILEESFTDEYERIIYKQWTSTDNSKCYNHISFVR